jgi:hypothetical protein
MEKFVRKCDFSIFYLPTFLVPPNTRYSTYFAEKTQNAI